MRVYGGAYVVFSTNGTLDAGSILIIAESKNEAIGKLYTLINKEYPSTLGYKQHHVSVTNGYVEGTVFSE